MMLQARGFDAYNLEGGMEDQVSEGLPSPPPTGRPAASPDDPPGPQAALPLTASSALPRRGGGEEQAPTIAKFPASHIITAAPC